MEQTLRSLTCTHCGKQIEIPAELETFSCLYCGEKLRMADYDRPAAAGTEAAADLEFAREHLFDCIRLYPDYFKSFTKKKYESSFRLYCAGMEDAYQALDRAVCAQPARRNALLEEFTDLFLEQWEAYHQSHPKAKTKAAREKLAFADKLTLAWYTVPAIRALDLSIGIDYTELLREKFVKRYPDNPFQTGTYEDLAGGFRKHGLCFITTAVCQYEGKPDDCRELTAFRSFRDGWLSETPEGRSLIAEYYEIAPAIVLGIEYCGRRDLEYDRIRRDYLTPCYQALEEGDYEACQTRYTRMVQDLRKQFLLN